MSVSTLLLSPLILPGLLPIAIAYNLAHYLALFVAQGPQVLALLVDPLGLVAPALGRRLPLPDPRVIWHVQVGVILAGHVIGMAVCRRRTAPRLRPVGSGWRPHLPQLLLMMALTASGL